MKTLAIELPMDEIRDFCAKWRIRELAVFGSILTDEFDDESDVDFLYTFTDDAMWSIFDVVDMRDELLRMLGRSVDLVCKDEVMESENFIRRRSILDNALVVHKAQ